MSNGTKIGVMVVLIVVVLGGLYWYSQQSSSPAVQSTTNSYTAPSQPAGYGTTPTTSQPSSPTPSTGTSAASNAQLDADLKSVDSQMGGMSSDSSNIDSGLNDQAGQQSSL